MKRRRLTTRILKKSWNNLYALNPNLAEYLKNVSGGGNSVLTEDLTATITVGGVDATTEYLAGTPLEQIIREILTDQAIATVAVWQQKSSGSVINSSTVRSAGAEITVDSLNYTFNDLSATLVPNSTTLSEVTSNTTFVTGQPNADGEAVNVDLATSAYGQTFTFGGEASTLPFPYTTGYRLLTAFKVSANVQGGGAPVTKTTTHEHVLPAFLMNFTALAPGGVKASFLSFDGNAPNQASFQTNLETLALLPVSWNHSVVKYITGSTNLSNIEWKQNPSYALHPDAASSYAWEHVFFMPAGRDLNLGAQAYTNGAINENFFDWTAQYNINLNFLGIDANAPDAWTVPYKVFVVQNVNAISATTEPINLQNS